MNSLDLDVRRLLAHIDRISARRFLANPEPPTGFADFPDHRDDAIGRIQRAAREELNKEQP